MARTAMGKTTQFREHINMLRCGYRDSITETRAFYYDARFYANSHPAGSMCNTQDGATQECVLQRVNS